MSLITARIAEGITPNLAKIIRAMAEDADYDEELRRGVEMPSTEFTEEDLAKLAKIEQEILDISSWDNAEAEIQATKANEESAARWNASIKRRKELAALYQPVIDELANWKVPKALEEYRSDLNEEIQSGFNRDCTLSSEGCAAWSAEEYKQFCLDLAQRKLNNRRADIEKRISRERNRAMFINALRDELLKLDPQPI